MVCACGAAYRKCYLSDFYGISTAFHWNREESWVPHSAVNMVFSDYAKQRILCYYNQRLKAPSISKCLAEEGIKASRVGVHKFLRSYQSSASIARRPGSGRRSKLTDEVRKVVEEKMREDDETIGHAAAPVAHHTWLYNV